MRMLIMIFKGDSVYQIVLQGVQSLALNAYLCASCGWHSYQCFSEKEMV